MGQHTLSDGRVATVRKGKVKDLVAAQRKTKSQEEVPFALVAELTTVNGQPVIFEDMLEWDLEDFALLSDEVTSGKKDSPAPGTSSTSAPPPGGASPTSSS